MLNEAVCKNALVPLVLRVSLAVIFIYNGAIKVFGPDSDWGAFWAVALWQQRGSLPPRVAESLDELRQKAEKSKDKKSLARITTFEANLKINYRHATPDMPESLRFNAIQLAVAWGELASGVALLFGLLTRLSALAMIVIQLGAIWLVTLAKGFSFSGGGYEYNVALLAMCLALLLLGGGDWSLDRLVWRKKKRQPAPAPAVAA